MPNFEKSLALAIVKRDAAVDPYIRARHAGQVKRYEDMIDNIRIDGEASELSSRKIEATPDTDIGRALDRWINEGGGLIA